MPSQQRLYLLGGGGGREIFVSRSIPAVFPLVCPSGIWRASGT